MISSTLIDFFRRIICASGFLLLVICKTDAQNKRADGYKGIWFTLGQFSEFGDKYSGGLGTYTSSHIPIAIYSKPVKKTFFVYGGTTSKDEKHLLIMLSYYDHKNNIVPKPVVVYDKMGVDDRGALFLNQCDQSVQKQIRR